MTNLKKPPTQSIYLQLIMYKVNSVSACELLPDEVNGLFARCLIDLEKKLINRHLNFRVILF